MSQIKIDINDKSYTFLCKDGDENDLVEAAKEFNNKLKDLKKIHPKSSSDMLMTIAILELQGKVLKLKKDNENMVAINSKHLKFLNTQFDESINKIRILTEKLQSGSS